MSEDRIKELQGFADDFKHRLKQARERYEQKTSKTMIEEKDQKENKSKSNNLLNSHKKIQFRKRYVNNTKFLIFIKL
jgi:hypothetical protein